MSQVAYYDRKMKPISKARWQELIADQGYSVLRRFRDERVHIEARWVGKLVDPQNHFPYMRPIFSIVLFNRGTDGSWKQDPRHGMTYYDEKKLLQDYSDFLLEWTQSTIDDDGSLLEVGNQLEAVPEPASLTKTTSAKNLVGVSAEVTAVGAW